MIIVYRPDLDNPPMDKDSSLGFSFMPSAGNRKVEHVSLSAGVHRDFDSAVWDKIKDKDVIKRLLSLGAIRIEEEKPTAHFGAPSAAEVPTPKDDSISDLSLTDALRLIEDSFDLDQLKKWDAKDKRIRVKNAVSKRVTAITTGNG